MNCIGHYRPTCTNVINNIQLFTILKTTKTGRLRFFLRHIVQWLVLTGNFCYLGGIHLCHSDGRSGKYLSEALGVPRPMLARDRAGLDPRTWLDMLNSGSETIQGSWLTFVTSEWNSFLVGICRDVFKSAHRIATAKGLAMFFTDSGHHLGFWLCHLWNDSWGRPGGADIERFGQHLAFKLLQQSTGLNKLGLFFIEWSYGRKHKSGFVTISWPSLCEELDVWLPFEASIHVRIY